MSAILTKIRNMTVYQPGGGGGSGGVVWVTPPTSDTSPGTAGQVAYDGSYFYVCVATNTWVRAMLNDWTT